MTIDFKQMSPQEATEAYALLPQNFEPTKWGSWDSRGLDVFELLVEYTSPTKKIRNCIGTYIYGSFELLVSIIRVLGYLTLSIFPERLRPDRFKDAPIRCWVNLQSIGRCLGMMVINTVGAIPIVNKTILMWINTCKNIYRVNPISTRLRIVPLSEIGVGTWQFVKPDEDGYLINDYLNFKNPISFEKLVRDSFYSRTCFCVAASIYHSLALLVNTVRCIGYLFLSIPPNCTYASRRCLKNFQFIRHNLEMVVKCVAGIIPIINHIILSALTSSSQSNPQLSGNK